MLAIVPVKGFRGAKSRLAAVLGPEERAALVRRMLADVVAACRSSGAVSRILVVTPEPEVAPDGVEVLSDSGHGHAAAVALALADARASQGALLVMADCALATGESLDRLAAAARPVALAPARDGGLNALALQDPAAFAPVFGVPGAAELTVAAARAVGIEPAVLDEPALALDVDGPGELRFVQQLEACA